MHISSFSAKINLIRFAGAVWIKTFRTTTASKIKSIWDYNKVTGYAMIYSSFEEVPIEDISISFVVIPKPIKLFDRLVNGRGFEVEEVNNGIY